MTKPVTAAAAMLLAESGELELDTPVGEYLPGFKNSRVWCGDHSEPADRPILISDLLTMTSGLTYGDDDTVTELATRKLLAEAEERLKGDTPMTTLEFAERAGEIPLDVYKRQKPTNAEKPFPSYPMKTATSMISAQTPQEYANSE